MTREERLNTCGRCLHRRLDFSHGYLCNLTGKAGDFKDQCKDFTRDGTVTDSLKLRVRIKEPKRPVITEPAAAPAEPDETSSKKKRNKLTRDALRQLKKYQSFVYALMGGIIAAIAISVAWAVAAEMISFPEVYLALGAGLLTGLVIRFFGAGINRLFGVLGGIFTVLGCLLGSYFSRTGILEQAAATGYQEALAYIRPELIINSLLDSYVPLDLLFYGLAIVIGYLLSIRRIGAGMRKRLNKGEGNGAPVFHWLRLPLIIAGILAPVYFGYTQMKGNSGWLEYYDESGQKISEGELLQGIETGKWSYWYENGNLKCTGFYTDGTRDSLWKWYDESGRRLEKSGMYHNGLEHGSWVHYHSNGTISDSGAFADGYRDGTWKYWHDNGTLSRVGEWSAGEQSGRWMLYHNNGQQAEEVYYQDGHPVLTESVWDRDGVQVVRGGNGEYRRFSKGGTLVETGEIENGSRIGIWKHYYENGNIREEGIYMDDRYLVRNSWAPDGTREVVEGHGAYHSYYADSEHIAESGEIQNGNREGAWKTYFRESGNLKEEAEYSRGQQFGLKNLYFESGQLRASGRMVYGAKEDEWHWYHENGKTSVTVTFKNGKKHGKEIRINTRGIIVQEVYYEDGVLI